MDFERYAPPRKPKGMFSNIKYFLYQHPGTTSVPIGIGLGFAASNYYNFETGIYEFIGGAMIVWASFVNSLMSAITISFARHHEYFRLYAKKPDNLAARIWNTPLEHPELFILPGAAAAYTAARTFLDWLPESFDTLQAYILLYGGTAGYSTGAFLARMIHTNNIKKAGHRALSSIAKWRGNIEGSIRHLEKACDFEIVAPFKRRILSDIGDIYLEQGNFVAAMQHYRRALLGDVLGG